MRDPPDGFTVVTGAVGPSHGFVYVVYFDQPIEVMGLKFAPGALVHADRHRAVVIPEDVASALEAAIAQLFKSEKVVLDATKGKRIGFAKSEVAWAAVEASPT